MEVNILEIIPKYSDPNGRYYCVRFNVPVHCGNFILTYDKENNTLYKVVFEETGLSYIDNSGYNNNLKIIEKSNDFSWYVYNWFKQNYEEFIAGIEHAIIDSMI